MKPEKQFNLWDIEGTAFIEDHKEGSYHIGKTEDVDINSLRNITKSLNSYADENEQLKQQLSEQGTQIDFLKDENKHMRKVLEENKELKEKLKIKQKRIDAYEDYIKTLKEDGVLE